MTTRVKSFAKLSKRQQRDCVKNLIESTRLNENVIVKKSSPAIIRIVPSSCRNDASLKKEKIQIVQKTISSQNNSSISNLNTSGKLKNYYFKNA